MGGHLNPKRAADLRRLSRTEVKTLTEVFIGHGNLAYHRHKTGVAESPLFRLVGKTTKLPPIYSAIVQQLGTNDRFSRATSP